MQVVYRAGNNPSAKSEKEVPLSLLQATWDGRTDLSLKDYFSGFYVKYVKRQSWEGRTLEFSAVLWRISFSNKRFTNWQNNILSQSVWLNVTGL